jgi:hypothetical protein
MQKASHSRHKPWDGEAADLNTGSGLREHSEERITRGARRKVRPRKYPSILLTGTLLATAGLAAGALIYPDRAADIVRKQEWMTPSAAWSTIFPDRSASVPFMSRGDTPVPRSAPTQAATPPGLINAAVSYPTSTASVAVNKATSRDLPWLPESGKPQDQPAVGATPALLKAAAAPPEVAAPKPVAVAPVEAAPAAPKVAVAPPEPNPAPPPAVRAPSDADVADLIDRARTQIQVGDITGARLLLQRAAGGREPVALMALAETYDPAMLARWGSRGIKGDAAKARELYQAAAESGLAEARTRVLAVR